MHYNLLDGYPGCGEEPSYAGLVICYLRDLLRCVMQGVLDGVDVHLGYVLAPLLDVFSCAYANRIRGIPCEDVDDRVQRVKDQRSEEADQCQENDGAEHVPDIQRLSLNVVLG